MPVADPPGSRIVNYEVLVENEVGCIFKALLPRDARSVRIPPEILDPAEDYKAEVLARERSGNQTISEREFRTRD